MTEKRPGPPSLRFYPPGKHMERVLLADVARALRAPVECEPDALINGISIDSRTVAPGELFVAIKGERLDGHRFVPEALSKGAAGAVVSTTEGLDSAERPLLVVSDTVLALQEIAAWYRSRFELPVVAVTGTNGKTTTKDMAAAVLSARLATLKTDGNFNNHIGVPLTLFRLSEGHDAAVVEMGMNHPGEISRLAAVARPRIGVITNVAEAHLETMMNIESIARAKGELLDALPPDGTAVLNADDERVMSQAGRSAAAVVTFGLSERADVRAASIEEAPDSVSFDIVGGGRVRLPVPGGHNVANALAAAAVGSVLGIDLEQACDRLGRFEASPMRMKVQRIGRLTVINDAYNCNPGSLKAALSVLVGAGDASPTAAALGDMLELGARSDTAHREAGLEAARLGVDYLFLFGREVEALRRGALEGGMPPERTRVFDSKTALVRALQAELDGPAVLLVKGSRAMRMEEVVEGLMREAPAS
jgi:UDP-N-acetylmuramoyl-tripeptide--D-alanyl-D-alanine ligase